MRSSILPRLVNTTRVQSGHRVRSPGLKLHSLRGSLGIPGSERCDATGRHTGAVVVLVVDVRCRGNDHGQTVGPGSVQLGVGRVHVTRIIRIHSVILSKEGQALSTVSWRNCPSEQTIAQFVPGVCGTTVGAGVPAAGGVVISRSVLAEQTPAVSGAAVVCIVWMDGAVNQAISMFTAVAVSGSIAVAVSESVTVSGTAAVAISAGVP